MVIPVAAMLGIQMEIQSKANMEILLVILTATSEAIPAVAIPAVEIFGGILVSIHKEILRAISVALPTVVLLTLPAEVICS